MTEAPDHTVQFYEDDSFLLDSVAGFIGDGLRAGDAGIVILTAEHGHGLDERLVSQGIDLMRMQSSGRYMRFDTSEVLPKLMMGEEPDAERFANVIGDVIARAALEQRPVRVFGELVAVLALEGNHAGAVRLEQLWNDLQRAQPFSLLCAYPLAAFGEQDLAGSLHHVCAEHSTVRPAESFVALVSDDARARAVADLQQKAVQLEAEIAGRKRAEGSLRVALEAEQAARRDAEVALRLRDEFLSIAAHDLKTPLTVLSGHAQLLLRQIQRGGQVESERVLESAEEITEQATKLAVLVNHLLDTSTLEAGKMTIDRRSVDLAGLAGRVVAGRQVCTDRHTLSLDCPESLVVVVDPMRIEQVLTNLLDNALKYSPDGGRVELTLHPVADSMVELSIRDHGIGVPEEMRAHIFERFYQAHGSRYRSGLGLGLFISREIVELHGGSIRAEFPSDGGSHFVVTLPLGPT